MKLWIFGGSGVLGRHVVAVAGEQGHDIFAPTREACAIDNEQHVTRLFATAKAMKNNGPRVPDAIINCAGAVKGHSIRNMILSNSLGPHHLAHLGIRLVHMSTDCVFAGDQAETWLRESDITAPLDVYGRSKLLGEPADDHVAVVRGSFIDPAGGFLHWLLGERDRVEAWADAYWNGTSARKMAEQLVRIAGEEETGIIHVAAPDYISKAWMVEYFVEQLDLPITVIELTREPKIRRILEASSPVHETVPVKEMCNELIKELLP